jgi:hypothetical protein
MRKKIIILIFFSFFIQKTKAQSYSDALSFNAGVTQDGLAVSVTYNYLVNRHDFIVAGVFGSVAKYKYVDNIKVPYNDFTVTLGYSKNLFFDRLNTFNVNVSAGGLFGYEAINNGDKELSNGAVILSDSGFIFGAFAGVEGIYNISENSALLLNATEFYHANSSLGEFIPFLSLGLRYYLN